VVEGRLQSILSGERLALNFLQRLSGIATYTATLKEIIKDFPVNIIDTRKTIPGLRVLEKYAVRVGGGYNHRFGLFDGILIKNNHLKIAGGVTRAVQKARKNISPLIKIEVEVEDLAGVEEALAAGVDIIMLDNMAPEVMRQAVKIIDGRARTEASGKVNEANILEVAKSGVDFISVGAITHSARALDISLSAVLAGR
jgi:nicotinate-nucleotide pyrophosphorylase (carboxylating)